MRGASMLPFVNLRASNLASGGGGGVYDTPTLTPTTRERREKRERRERREGGRVGDAVPVAVYQTGGWWWAAWEHDYFFYVVMGFVGVTALVVLVMELLFYATAPVSPTSSLCGSKVVQSDSFAASFVRTTSRWPSEWGGYSSCAVVGSAGFLRLQRLGKEIDAHELVIRANLAPVGGYEPIVGSKTTFRVINSEAIGAILDGKSCSSNATVRQSICPFYPVYLNTGNWDYVSKFKKLCPRSVFFTNQDLDAWDPALHAQWQGLGVNLMSGAYALAIALKLCPNSTTVYGVTHAQTLALNNDPDASYHYYDDRPQSAYDSLPTSARALTKLAENQASCIRLHDAGAQQPAPKFELPKGEPAVRDALVDDVSHEKSRSHYVDYAKICMS